MKGAPAWLALIAAVLLLLVLAPGSGAQSGGTIPAGFDLFETDPEQTVFTFEGKTEIPANFFAEGSAPFDGAVNFGGEPIVRFMGRDVGSADTVIERPDPIQVPPGGEFSFPGALEL